VVNLDGLRELAELFKHRWDPIILALVTERPRRFSELAHEVRDRSGEHISDGVLSLTLARLIVDGFITKRQSGRWHSLYAPTIEAHSRVQRLQQLSELAIRSEPNGPRS
jgi:DNA-binding HxlR family transcriptional regulator